MEVIYDDNGKSYVPASEFYKHFVYDHLAVAIDVGEDFYDKMQHAMLHRLVLDSEVYDTFDKKLKDEMLYVMSQPYDTMKRWVESTKKNGNIPEAPKLKLVK